MLLFENFLVILGFIAIFALLNEYAGLLIAIVFGIAAIGAAAWAYSNLDAASFSALAGIVVLYCAAVWNKRRFDRNKRTKQAAQIANANAAIAAAPASPRGLRPLMAALSEHARSPRVRYAMVRRGIRFWIRLGSVSPSSTVKRSDG